MSYANENPNYNGHPWLKTRRELDADFIAWCERHGKAAPRLETEANGINSITRQPWN
jgi:hypothetical protein